jgi:hypothetical protein
MKTELCDLAYKWRTDKAIFYTPFYHALFKNKRNNVKKVLEIGIGYPHAMVGSISRVGMVDYVIGASLFMWQDYFPQAQIFAFDNKSELLINEGRIQSFYCDQSSDESLAEAMSYVGHDFDLIVEDGSHIREHQLLSMNHLVPLLSDTGYYFMEDINEPYDELINQVPYTRSLKTFYRRDIPAGENISALLAIKKTKR